MVYFSFCLFLLLFVIIGVLSMFKGKGTKEDYYLAGQKMSPWLVALSAVATNNSGYMFVGMIGLSYTQGLSSIWLMIGWVFGDLLASLFAHKKIRTMSEKRGVFGLSELISRWTGENYFKVRKLSALITIIFLGTYAAAQFKAGSKALHVLFGWDPFTGAILGSAIVFIYCLVGGIRASIWTDVAQSFVMIFSMALLCFVAIQEIGGVSQFVMGIKNVSSEFSSFVPVDQINIGILGPLLFVLGWMMAGFGVMGQPHIMTRFMTLKNSNQMGRVRVYYYSWYLLFFLLTICVGLSSRLLIPNAGSFDAELALPMLAMDLLPQFFVGLILAGLFAATMSTADSQILSCSSALTQDLIGEEKSSIWMSKLGTLIITLISLGVALYGGKNVFHLVVLAWSALMASFAPLIILFCLGKKPTENECLVVILGGLFSSVTWSFLNLGHLLFDGAVGTFVGFLLYALMRIPVFVRKYQYTS